MVTETTVAIVGSGFGGQCAAMNLLKRGLTDFVMLERRSFMGGTWLQNAYPGAAVDVASPLYSLADEPYDWSQMFATRQELEDYTRHVIDKHGLAERTLTDADVQSVVWDGSAWLLDTTAGQVRARFVVNATGPLSTPVIPEIEGRERFGGAQFHTNDWDPSVDLRGKRVAVVGSGASAAQVIPAIEPLVEELHVFQRTPHWVLPRPDRVFSRTQRRLMRRPGVHRAVRTAIYWSLETRILGFKYSRTALHWLATKPALRHLARQVPDEGLRATLTPDFVIGCKRVLLSNTYYPALTRPHVRVHDRTDPIERLDGTGIVTASGEHLDVDVVVWSTGYDATDGVISYPVKGRTGATLGEHWDPYPRAYLGTTVPGFPNFFVITGPNTGIGHTSAIFVIESQMQYVVQAIGEVLGTGAETIEVTASAEEEYTAMVHREMEGTVWKTGGCHSWYQSRSGHVIAMFPGFSFTFRRLAARFRPEHHTIG